MGDFQRIGDLELEEDVGYLRKFWRVQRVGHALWFLTLIFALCGVFGHGWLAEGRSADAENQLTVEYERIAHFQSPCRMKISVDPSLFAGRELRLSINRDYLEHGTLRMISPEPSEMQTAGSRIIYTFRTAKADQSAHITVDLETEKFGLEEIEIGAVDGPTASFKQLILP
jgi:hypothetical protein